MSADNGIYILVTPIKSDDYVKHYRVIHCQSIEDIYWDADKKRMTDEIQPAMLREKFGTVQPFDGQATARDRAFEMAREIHDGGLPLEYGISEIHYDKPFPT